MSSALQHEQVQKDGIVGIVYNIDATKPNASFMEATTKAHLFWSLPFRHVAVHYCYNNPFMKHVMALFQLGLDAPDRLRFRSHFGAHLEVQYKLHAFGISVNDLPVDQNGNLRTDRNLEYIKQLKQRERDHKRKIREQRASAAAKAAAAAAAASPTVISTNPESSISSTSDGVGDSGANNAGSRTGLIDHPRPNDVLLQRGKVYQSHHGNVELTKLVETYRQQYNTATSQIEKSTINQMIVQLVHESGGRFIMRDKQDPTKWKEVPIEIAWERVARRYRK